MTWADLSDRMIRTAIAVMGEPVTYTRGASSVTVKAVWDRNYIEVDPNTGVAMQSANPMIGVRLADLPGGDATQGDRVTRSGVEYEVVEVRPDSIGHAKLVLQRV